MDNGGNPDRLTLVIGYGNSLRQDDGVGPLVAETVAQWSQCQSLAVHQLTPELALAIAGVDQVIFVDAYPSEAVPQVRVEVLTPGGEVPDLIHRSSPASLLALTQVLYGKTPLAWWVLIPGTDWGYGETLSAVAHQGYHQALEEIRQLINRFGDAEGTLQGHQN